MINKLLLYSADLISVFPLVIYFSLLYNFIIQPKKNIVDIILFLVIMIGNLLVTLLKSIKYPMPFYNITRRPKGSSNCDYFSRNGPSKKDAPGFPSGHMTSVSIFSSFMIFAKYYVSKEKNILKFISKNFLFLLANVGIVALTAFARYYKKCHSIFQIVCGTILGSIIGYLTFILCRKLKMLEFKDDRLLKF